MATRIEKITLSASRDIPLNKLTISQSNVRRIKAGVSIEDLAEDIARRTLLQSLTVRPVRDAGGAATGMYEIPAGGRRFRALELLVKQKRLARTALIPCIVRENGIAEEDSLAENIQRAPLHPLDQFRAFLALREQGQSEEEIAAAFFASVAVVRQRLKLASVARKVLDAYADDGLSLDQVMAFTVNGDHQCQEQVFDQLSQSCSQEPHAIRRMLTEGAVRAGDKRVRFGGLDAYSEAGGTVLRDLFQGDDGGWLQDAGLLDRLVAEQLRDQSKGIRAEGWKWVEVAPDFPYGHTFGLRQIQGEDAILSDDDQAARNALQAEYDHIEETQADAEELPEATEQRMGDIETALAVFDNRPASFEPDEIARAGAFMSIDGSGTLRIERGFVRPEDETPIGSVHAAAGNAAEATDDQNREPQEAAEPDEDDGPKPIPDRLMTELTAHRTLALRHALGDQPGVAFLAALHVLCLRVFYRYAGDSCLDIDLKSVGFDSQAPGLNDSASAAAIDGRHQAWIAALPKEPAVLWDALEAFESDSRQSLFAHCVSLSVNAVYEAYNRRPRALAYADRLAQAVDLDMAAAGWMPTVGNYLGRVTKAGILAAVREAKGEAAGDRIEHLKKGEMAEQAAVLLAGSGWLPEVLRTPGHSVPVAPACSDPSERAIAGSHAIAAE